MGISFQTAEEFFLNQKPAPFNWPEFNPVCNIKRVSSGARKMDGSIYQIVIFFQLSQKGLKGNDTRDIELARDVKSDLTRRC